MSGFDKSWQRIAAANRGQMVSSADPTDTFDAARQVARSVHVIFGVDPKPMTRAAARVQCCLVEAGCAYLMQRVSPGGTTDGVIFDGHPLFSTRKILERALELSGATWENRPG